MRKFISSFLVVAILALSFTGCADRKTINGVEYDTYGLLDSDTKKNPNIEYELQWGNIVWSILLAQFLFIPTIYFLGFSLYEPIGPKVTNPAMRGVVGGIDHITPKSTAGYSNTVYAK